MNRVFLIVLDSLGIGALPDAGEYGDVGADTLGALGKSEKLKIPVLRGLGLCNIDGVSLGPGVLSPAGSFARLGQKSPGKDTTIGHWELAGLTLPRALPTYPQGFPPEAIEALEKAWGRATLCNLPYSGTQVIDEFGPAQLKTGEVIVYTSADSVLQIAAHEEVIPLPQLYNYCESAREIMQGEHSVGRIIARPFVGSPGAFVRTAGRKDYSLEPPGVTLLDVLLEAGLDVIGVGKIYDIFAGRGLSENLPAKGNEQVMDELDRLVDRDFRGLCFANLVDFDMLYGHRNDLDGYAGALSVFDRWLGGFLPRLREGDLLLLTADHGCDPSFPGTDHSREYVPLVATGAGTVAGVNFGTRESFADVAASVQAAFGLPVRTQGKALQLTV